MIIDSKDIKNEQEEFDEYQRESLIQGILLNNPKIGKKYNEVKSIIETLDSEFKKYKKKHMTLLFQPRSQFGYGTEDYIRECEIRLFQYKEQLLEEFEEYKKKVEDEVRRSFENENSGGGKPTIKPFPGGGTHKY